MRDAKPLAALPGAAARARAHDAGHVFAALGFRRLVILNGSFAADMSDLTGLEPGLTVRSMADALALDEPLLSQGLGPTAPADDPALALNTALAGDGVVVMVSPGVAIERPIDLVFVNSNETPAAIGYAHRWWCVGGGARATFVERHEGRDDRRLSASMPFCSWWSVTRREVDHIRMTREGDMRPSTSRHFWPHVGARQSSTRSGLSRPEARSSAAIVRAAGRRGDSRQFARPEPLGGPAACRQDPRGRPRRRWLARAVRLSRRWSTMRPAACSRARSSCGRRRRRPTRKMGPTRCCCRRSRGDGRQARARDLRRRRRLRPRRHSRRARRPALFYLLARGIPERRGAGAADPRLSRREVLDRLRIEGICDAPMDAARGLVGATADDAMHPAVSNGELRRRGGPRRIPDSRSRSTASRWSIWTVPPRPRSRRR